MTASQKPPFRADQVGSLLRPPELHEARAKAATGATSRADLREVEDRAIVDAVNLQELVGLQGITDGEFRRAFWHVDFLTGFDGIVATQSNYAVSFKGEGGETAETRSMLVVNGKVSGRGRSWATDFAFCAKPRGARPRSAFPRRHFFHMRGGRKVVSAQAYPDTWSNSGPISPRHTGRRSRISPRPAGPICKSTTFPSPIYATGIFATQVKRDGEDPDRLPSNMRAIISDSIASGRPASASRCTPAAAITKAGEGGGRL